MVSVIVPVYQAVKTLDDCVQSILVQDYRDFELILVDDGSTDGSERLCDSYKDERVRVMHQQNGGAAKARNRGIKEANGEWICFVDSDDVIAPDYLSVLLALADDTESDIAVCAYAKCNKGNAENPKGFFQKKHVKNPGISVYRGKESVKALLYQRGFMSTPCCAISKRRLWDEVAFPEGTAAEDMGTIYRLFLAANCVSRTDAVLYGYVQSAGSTVYSTSSKRNPDYYMHSRKMLTYIKKNHPDCVKAAASRHFSTCFHILSETEPYTGDIGNEFIKKLYADIISLRSVVLKDKCARKQNRIAAALSYISIFAVHKTLYKRYQKLIPAPSGNIAMVEYQGRCDENGKAVGHAPKVLGEYYGMIRNYADVSIYAPGVILNEFSAVAKPEKTVTLKHKIVMKAHNSISEKIINKLRMFANINYALRHSDADTLWFFNVEFYFFLYLVIFGNKGRRIVVNLFIDGYHTGALSGIKQKIFEIGQKRIEACISTGPSFEFKNMDYIFIPDYFYDEGEYGRYRTLQKEDYAVCLGTMDKGKQLEELIGAFKGLTYRLVIAGRFYDKGRLEELKKSASDNIEIRDDYLGRDEYLSLLGHARYAVLPYNKDNYATQTSGVMQEAVFTDAIVLAHKDILTGNEIPGVDFDSYEDITDALLSDKGSHEEILGAYANLRANIYDKKKVCQKLSSYLISCTN